MPYEMWAKCPKCGLKVNGIDDIESRFGFRKIKGRRIPQSYCSDCRR